MANFFLFVALLILFSFAYAGFRGAPWVPTWKNDLHRVLALADLKPGEIFYDLGCGDGRMVCAAATQGAKAFGFELSLFPFILAYLRHLFHKKHGARFILRDFWYANFHDVDVIYFFLMPKVYSKLKQKLEQELKPGSRVITYVWPIPGWEAKIIDYQLGSPTLYLYQV